MKMDESDKVMPDHGGVSDQLPEAADMGSADGLGSDPFTIRVGRKLLTMEDGDALSDAADMMDPKPRNMAEREHQRVVAEYLRKLSREAREGDKR